MKPYTLALLAPFFLYSCASDAQLNRITKLPKELKENSGMAYYGGNSAWFVNDSGNPDKIYKVDFDGQLTAKFKVKNAKNRDWEELTTDPDGNLYIGDFGNNLNDRKNLRIYLLGNPETERGDKIEAEKISFHYPEQKDFPPKKKDRLYDAEAFFYFKGHLYIFTKNRTQPFSGETLLYRIPAQKGDHKAELIGRTELCTDWDTCRVTSADISKDGKTVVLLGYGKLYLFSGFESDNFFEGERKEFDLGIRTQLESVCFYDENTLLLSDEEENKEKEGRNLYTYPLK